jgi:hypothetical protein
LLWEAFGEKPPAILPLGEMYPEPGKMDNTKSNPQWRQLFAWSCFAGALLIATPLYALDYNEATDGDLSENPEAPTPLAFDLGANRVTGGVDGSGDVRDYMSFEIAVGQSLESLLLIEYLDATIPIPGNRGYHAIIDGPTSLIPDFENSDQFLGGDHLDQQPSGTDLLPLLAAAPLAGVGFDVPLGPGTYTYHLQQTSPAPTRYVLEFVVVPEPSTAMMLLMGLALMRVGRGKEA